MFLSTSSQSKKQLEFKASGFSSKSSDSFVIVTLQVNIKMSYDKKMKQNFWLRFTVLEIG